MSNDQPRQPSGTPTGGQFTAAPRTEATTHLSVAEADRFWSAAAADDRFMEWLRDYRIMARGATDYAHPPRALAIRDATTPRHGMPAMTAEEALAAMDAGMSATTAIGGDFVAGRGWMRGQELADALTTFRKIAGQVRAPLALDHLRVGTNPQDAREYGPTLDAKDVHDYAEHGVPAELARRVNHLVPLVPSSSIIALHDAGLLHLPA